MKKILVLEDEANIRSFVVLNLNRAGYETIEAGTGEEALEQLRLNPDVRMALLDIMLPDMDGFEVCRRIRASNSKIGIIMLTARTQEMDKVTGFMTGADDYVTKPFSPAELTARIDALYRRTGGETMDDGEIQQPPFVLNTRKRTLEKNGQRVKLTQVEYAIVKMFMENPGKALSREEILKFVWGENYLGELRGRYSRREIEARLYKRGLPREEIRLQLESLTQEDEEEACGRALGARYPRGAAPEERQKAWQYLCRKGYGAEVINKVLGSTKEGFHGREDTHPVPEYCDEF